MKGGALGIVRDQVTQIDRTLGNERYESTKNRAGLIVVQSAGKPRPLTKFHSEALLLKPAHKSIYEHLSRTTNWLCRGDPTAERLAKAGFRKDLGSLTSGDYRSATNNLSLEVAELILEVIFENSVSIPADVQEHARNLLRPVLVSDDYDLEFTVTRGQMMGSYLSFPLLCIQNFLGFDYARREAGLGFVPLLINGDDIIFQSSRDFSARWRKVVGSLGLEVEPTKTSVSDDYGTLNSTLFRWKDGLLYVVPTFRFGMLRSSDYPVTLGANFFSFLRGFEDPKLRYRGARCFFSWHLSELKGTRLTLDELGFRGALAFRVGRIFGLVDIHDLTIVHPPRAPIPHNVILSSDRVTMVDEKTVSKELMKLNGRQMASWKYGVNFVECREKMALRYCLAMSSVRTPQISFHIPRFHLTDVSSWRKIRTKRFFRPLYGEVKTVPILDEILLTQDVSEYEVLPTYEESQGRGGGVSLSGSEVVTNSKNPLKH
jgi:hypothetical protein